MFYVLICFFVMSTGFEVQFSLVLCDVLAYNLELFHPQWQSSTFFLIYSSSHLLKVTQKLVLWSSLKLCNYYLTL